MQHYLLTEVGHEYTGEVGTQGHDRAGALEWLESQLAALIKSSNALRKRAAAGPLVASPKPNRGFVDSLRKYHENQISNVGALERANAEIIKYRQWLFRMQAILTPAGKIIWPKSCTKVAYDNDLQKEFTKLSIVGGQFFTHDRKPFDTRRMVTAMMGPGYCIYVMSAEGNLHVSSHSVGHRHHSSLLGGSMVAGAGELKVTTGRLEYLSNKSGHYRPDFFQFVQTLGQLYVSGVPPTFRVNFFDASGPKDYDNVESFLAANNFDNTNYEWMRMFYAYQKHLTDEFWNTHWKMFIPNGLGAFSAGVLDYKADPPRVLTLTEFEAFMSGLGLVKGYSYRSGAGR